MLGRLSSEVRRQWMGALALFLVVAGGGAYAAIDPIGSDGDIDACFEKDSGDLRLLKGKKCGKKAKPLSWNAAGAQGPTGPAGPAGRSALEPLQTGETVRGVIGGGGAGVEGAQWYFTATFPIPMKAPLTNADIMVDGNDEVGGACTGTYGNPTAPPGKVCVYLEPSSSNGSSIFAGPLGFDPATDRYGFALFSSEATPSTLLRTWGTWAATGA